MASLKHAVSSAGMVLIPALRRLNTERSELIKECATAHRDLIRSRKIRDVTLDERDRLVNENQALQRERKELCTRTESLSAEVEALKAKLSENSTWVPPGHDYSPIPDPNRVWEREDLIFDRTARTLPGVDMRESAQREMHDEFLGYYDRVQFPKLKTEGQRYFYENNFFPYSDAFFLNCMIRHFRPNSIVEVGSGFSSAVSLDTIDALALTSTICTFIDPHPERLLTLLSPEDQQRHRIIEDKVESAPLSEFDHLDAGDILFIDSSHVSKTGSDVNHVFFEVLPRLKSGVLVHIHDIPYPFEYSKSDVYEGRAWNEAYLARAFLQFNSAFEVLFYPSYVAALPVEPGSPRTWGVEWFENRMPKCAEFMGPSLWLRKL